MKDISPAAKVHDSLEKCRGQKLEGKDHILRAHQLSGIKAKKSGLAVLV